MPYDNSGPRMSHGSKLGERRSGVKDMRKRMSKVKRPRRINRKATLPVGKGRAGNRRYTTARSTMTDQRGSLSSLRKAMTEAAGLKGYTSR